MEEINVWGGRKWRSPLPRNGDHVSVVVVFLVLVNQPLTTQANSFGLMDDFFPIVIPSNSFICIQKTINIMPTWISTHRHTNYVIWRWLECGGKCVKVGSGHVFLLCWEFMWGCWLQPMFPTLMQLCMNRNDVHFDKGGIHYDVHVRTTFVLTSTAQFDIWTLTNF